MKGFTDRAIILLPRFSVYDTKPDEWRRLFRLSIKGIVDYMNMCGIDVYSFNTDELTEELKIKEIKQLDVLTMEDRMLLETFYLGGKTAPEGESIDKEIFKEVRKKYPAKRGTSNEEKLELFYKRDRWISNKLIGDCKLIINCELKSSAHYKVQSKEGDQRIIVNMSHLNFTVDVTLSGLPVDSIDIFNYNKAYSPLHNWEVI